MIGKLRGIVDSVELAHAIVDVQGVGYLVFASARTLEQLVPGETVALVIETHVREDHIHLFGFKDAAEKIGSIFCSVCRAWAQKSRWVFYLACRRIV